MRVGLIGCGGIGEIRATALDRLEGWSLAAVADPVARRAEAVAGPRGAEIASWDQVVERTDVDAVIVCTPPDAHAEVAVAALRAGKHVLCEKPLAPGVEEARLMVEAADAANRLLATGFNYRFYPSVEKARELLRDGAIGELDHVRSYAGYPATEHGHDWIHDPQVMGGGVLRDNGIHLIDLTRWFLGEVEEARGYATGRVWRFPGCEDNGMGVLRSVDGRLAALHATWNEWRGYTMRIELYGERGCIRLWCFPMRTELVSAAERGGRTRSRTWWFPGTMIMEHLRSYRWVVRRSFEAELRAFAAAAGGNPGALATGTDGVRSLEIADAIAGGSRTGADHVA